jgi:hypothetical protein
VFSTIGSTEDIGMQAWGGDGRAVRAVALRDVDSVVRVEHVLDAVETFGTEFVVREAAEEFGDEDFDFIVALRCDRCG